MNKSKWLSTPMWVGAIGGFLIAMVLFLSISMSTGDAGAEVSNEEVLQQSNDIYSDVLIAPSTASFASMNDEDTTVQALGNNYYYVSTYVDSQNENAAQVRDTYTMWLSYDSNAEDGARWEEVSLSEIQDQ